MFRRYGNEKSSIGSVVKPFVDKSIAFKLLNLNFSNSKIYVKQLPPSRLIAQTYLAR